MLRGIEHILNKSILLQTDNTMLMAYINKQVGQGVGGGFTLQLSIMRQFSCKCTQDGPTKDKGSPSWQSFAQVSKMSWQTS
jgi:hypothetical protein